MENKRRCVLKVKAVLFDLGGTLVTEWSLGATFHKILLSLGINRSLEEAKEASSKAWKDFDAPEYDHVYGILSHKSLWNLWRSFVLRHLGLGSDKRLQEKIESRRYDYVECDAYPDVRNTLAKLRSMGLRIGLVSIAYEEDVWVILKEAGLERDLFDVIVGGNTTNAIKPHQEPFRYALERLRIKPKEALFVGNEVEADYRAAKRTGMKAVLIQRSEENVKARGLRTINTLEEIFRFIN
jgi:putative hydrolase of the HAD superfamily